MARMPLVVPERPTRTTPPPPDGALVLVAADLLLRLVEDANPDATFTVSWGTPQPEVCSVYEPVFTRHQGEAS